jgi:hypothetical protein
MNRRLELPRIWEKTRRLVFTVWTVIENRLVRLSNELGPIKSVAQYEHRPPDNNQPTDTIARGLRWAGLDCSNLLAAKTTSENAKP